MCLEPPFKLYAKIPEELQRQVWKKIVPVILTCRAKTGGAASRSAICVCVVRMSYKHTSKRHCHDIFLHITVITYIYIYVHIIYM